MTVLLIEFDNFRDKIRITKEYFRQGKIEILENRYIYIEMVGAYE
ncbi:hypothetical protein [Gudongella sp. SC589]